VKKNRGNCGKINRRAQINELLSVRRNPSQNIDKKKSPIKIRPSHIHYSIPFHL